MDNKEILGTQPIRKLLMKLAVPTVTAQLINMLYNIVDRIYIGHIPEVGSLALTGVGVCMPLIMIVSAFAALISSGGAPKASILMGKGEKESAEKIMGGCFVLQIGISLILTILLFGWNKEILLLFGASENTIEYASSYMTLYSLGTIFVQLTLGMGAFITAQGFAKIGMMTVLLGAVTNLILDPVFIYGLEMGVEGAALATIVSQAVSAVWVLVFLTGKKTHLKLKRKYLKIDGKLVFPCIALGLSSFIMQSSESIISVCFNSSLLKYGGDIAVGAMTILTSVMQFAMLPMQGIAQGAQPIISYNFGAGNSGRVKEIIRLLFKTCMIYSVTIWIVIMAVPQIFAAIFTADLQLIGFTAEALRIYCAVLCLFGIQIACQMTFISMGNAICSITVAVVRKFVLLIPLIYFLPGLLQNQTRAVYLAEPVADLLAVAFTAILFTRKVVRKINEVSNQQ